MERLAAYILAGGRSSRFGSDKARALLHGTPLIVRVARLVEGLGLHPRAVARVADQYQDLGLETIADPQPGLGPVGGVRTALRHRAEGWLLLLSCDMLTLRRGWVEQLLLQADESQAVAVAFRDTRWQPFPSLLHTRLLARPGMDGCRSMQSVFQAAAARPVPLPPDWPAILQANTPDDLRRAQRLASEAEPAG